MSTLVPLDQVKQLWADGVPIVEIAVLIDISYSYTSQIIYDMLRRGELPQRQRPKPRPPLYQDESDLGRGVLLMRLAEAEERFAAAIGDLLYEDVAPRPCTGARIHLPPLHFSPTGCALVA